MSVKLIDFWAPWCGPCKSQDPILHEMEKDLKDVTFVKVNVDENPEAAMQYGVMSIPTLVIEKDGEMVGRFVGLTGRKVLEGKLKEALEA